MAAMLLYMGFKNNKLEAKIMRREIDDLEVEANAKQVIIDDKEAEQGIRDAGHSRSSNLHHFN